MDRKLSDCAHIAERFTEKKVGNNIADAPKISVVIPVYNVAPYIKETLDSVFAQTYKNFEVVLINDGSEDTAELEEKLAPYFDKIVYGRQENLGASEARNAAICLARGDVIAFLDGDDVWLPGFLETQLDFIEKNNFEMVYCNALLFGEPLFAGKTYMQNSPSSGEVTAASLLAADCNVITSGTIVKKDSLVKVGLFDPQLRRMQDFDMWFRLAQAGTNIGYQRDILIKYRVRADSLTGTNISRAEREVSALNFIKSKYKLSAAEQVIWEKRIAVSEADLEMEKCKVCLAKNDFKQAQTHIAAANKYYHKLKLTLIAGLLKIAPKFTSTLFRKMRPAEFAFIAPENAEK